MWEVGFVFLLVFFPPPPLFSLSRPVWWQTRPLFQLERICCFARSKWKQSLLKKSLLAAENVCLPVAQLKQPIGHLVFSANLRAFFFSPNTASLSALCTCSRRRRSDFLFSFDTSTWHRQTHSHANAAHPPTLRS